MEPLRVLITNHALDTYSGTELYVRDLARRLLRLGHTPVVYTPVPGLVAEELRLATVPVVDDLASLGNWVPDVIHCHHTLQTILALLHFPGVPAVYVCHDWSVWFDQAPPLERVVRHVAVDETCRDRMQLVHGVPADQLRVIHNWVDLDRFRPRDPLSPQPERALVFSNYARESSHLGPVREACERLGIPLDVAGLAAGTWTARPEDMLPSYDIVFAKARCALEAMAVGAAVVLCDARGLGPMVTSAEFDRLRRLNFGARSLQGRLDPEGVVQEIKRYDPLDAAAVSERVRGEAGLEATVDQLIALYREAVVAGKHIQPDPAGEARVLATVLRPVSKKLREAEQLALAVAGLQAERDAMAAGRDAMAAERNGLQAELERVAFDAESNRRDVAIAREEEQERAAAALGAAERRLEQAEAARSAEGARYQQELETSKVIAREQSEAAAALRRELDTLRATFTFRLRTRLLRLPVLGRLLRFGVRMIRGS